MNASRSILAALALVALAPPAVGTADAAAAKKPKKTAVTAAAAKHAMAVPFLEDDYGKALAEARARKVPIFIEAWAPW
jgi:hypothetical protein